MACTLQTLKGIGEFCGTNLAGIKEVWLGEYAGFKATPGSAHNITTLEHAGESTALLYHYAFAKQTGSLTSNITIDEANGVRYYTHEIALQFSKMEAAKHAEVEALAAGQLVAIVHDNNDNYWYVGYDTYVSATAVTAQSGQSFGDLNGYTTTLSTMDSKLPYAIEKSVFEGLVDTETGDDL